MSVAERSLAERWRAAMVSGAAAQRALPPPALPAGERASSVLDRRFWFECQFGIVNQLRLKDRLDRVEREVEAVFLVGGPEEQRDEAAAEPTRASVARDRVLGLLLRNGAHLEDMGVERDGVALVRLADRAKGDTRRRRPI